MPEPLLKVRNLTTGFDIGDPELAIAVKGVSFDILPGEILGIVGESGSGKSVTALSIMRLIPSPPGQIIEGEIIFDGQDILKLSYEKMRKIRGKDIGMIFQEPMTSLNPVFTIGMQVSEAVMHHEGLDKAAARVRAAEMMDLVGIPSPKKRLDDYPHQFSGGMRQRVMIAMSLICNPKLLIADEPTTALDVTIQAQILELMIDLQKKRPGAAIALITHDLAVVAETCDRVLVMYGGRIQEVAPIEELFDNPIHPYTKGLLGSIPDRGVRGKPLQTIQGKVPSIRNFPAGCRFRNRCDHEMPKCGQAEPELKEVAPGHEVRCYLVDEGGAQ